MEIKESLLKVAIKSKLLVRAFRDYDSLHVNYSFITDTEITAPEYDVLMKLLNLNGRFDDYKKYLEYEISCRVVKPMTSKEYTLDIGAVFFLELMLRDEDDDPYQTEPIQFYLLLDPSWDSVKTITRRGTKSFSDKVVAFRNCMTNNRYGVLTTEQSWTVAKSWLDDVYLWYERNPLLQEWSGGRLRKDSDHHVEFANRSSIMCYTASNLVNVRGTGVRMQINDEKSAYTTNTAVSRIIARGQKKKLGKMHTLFRTSGTPLGAGTDFHKDQVNPEKWQYFAPIICPMGYRKPVCYDCEYFSVSKYRRGELHTLHTIECFAPIEVGLDGRPDFSKAWKRIPDNRLTFEELVEDWLALGKTLWTQEYMCATQEYAGNAIPLELMNMVVDDTLDIIYESKMPVIIGVDFGLTENHNSTYTVVAKTETGILQNIHTHVFPVGTPYRSRMGQIGVIETVLAQLKNYPNCVMIVADATGVGKPLVEHDMIDMARNQYGFSNIVPYKITGDSKEFLGKSQLWFSLIKPAMETGRVKSYMERRLYSEMRAWQVDYDPSTQARPALHPPKAGAVQSDDAWMSFMLALWGGLSGLRDGARTTTIVEGIPSHEAYGPSAFERAGYYG